LWDIVTIALLSGLAAMSITTLLPACRRLKRQTVSGWKWAFPPKKARTAPSPGWARSGSDQTTGDWRPSARGGFGRTSKCVDGHHNRRIANIRPSSFRRSIQYAVILVGVGEAYLARGRGGFPSL